MKKNMGRLDRIIRLLAALAVIILYLTHTISGLIATILLIVAGLFVATSFMSFCPVYLPFGLSTYRKTKKS
ncbi:DUF2892 domain-containing protein [Mucilaginibacter sp. 10I4]|uniref:YgaP family membrane protein n=1 Tax=Mucilaginibacter sp. 10I4 TaxID=3048580 RepID=UPI002B2357A0|nr:DUF2892 domain-containing protein [Mucilaginibacter sp. 10I4]